jgi:hypothetical protein
LGQSIMIGQRFRGEAFIEPNQSGLVSQELAHRDPLFAALRKLWPIFRNWRIQFE